MKKILFLLSLLTIFVCFAQTKNKQNSEPISDEAFFNQRVESKVNEWLKKGEFEKENDTNIRIQNDYQNKFNEICLNTALDVFHSTVYSINNIGIYDSENEFFPAELILTNQSGGNYKSVTSKKVIEGKIFVPIADAEKFKNNYKYSQPIQLPITKFQLSEFKNFNWQISDGFFVPTKFEYLNFNKFYKFQFIPENISEIIIDAQNLNVTKKENLLFDFNSAINTYITNESLESLNNQNKISEKIDSLNNFEVRQSAEFPEGINSFRKKLSNLINTNNIKNFRGKITTTINLTIDENGEIKNIEATGLNPSFNKEIIRATKLIKDKWKPAKINGLPVESNYRLPLTLSQ